ncbi:MAG: glycosyltransferase family 2 protein [Ruminococcus flavefaciens]|nr:glycosyltransferase family 2 protein [Ruminococcus flavefaciens]MCM1362974.1 glycosyltransferase family 2 protein [Clostridiales bacterium]
MSNFQPKVSIISTVYNTSIKYLKVAFNSVKNQTYKNIEYIIIDDGSDDETAKFCHMFWKEEIKTGSVKLIQNENHGVSYSRNCGLELAGGEYIVFLDSDDALDINFVSTMLKAVANNNLRVAVCDFSKKGVANSERTENDSVPMTKFSGSSIWENLNTAYIWRTIYVADVIKNIRFDVNKKCCEDIVFFNEMLKRINNIGYVPMELYYYRQNPESITHRYSLAVCRDAIKTYEDVYFSNKSVTSSRIAYSEVFTNYARWLIRYLTVARKERSFSDFRKSMKICRKKVGGRTDLIKQKRIKIMILLLNSPCFVYYICIMLYNFMRITKSRGN